MLASDFGFLPNVEAGWPLVGIELLMHGNVLISPANGGIRDLAVFRTPSVEPSVSRFLSALDALPSIATSTLSGWLAAPNFCSHIWPSLLPNTYPFTLTRGQNFYSEPLESSLAAALKLAKADKARFSGTDYLRSLLLQGHCYQWRSNSLGSLREFRNMMTHLSAATQSGSLTLSPPSSSVVPFTVNQRAQFVRGSQHTIQCPKDSLSETISNSEQFNTFRSEYVINGVIGVLGIPGVSAPLLARYLTANIIDQHHFPDVQCISKDPTGSFSSSVVLLNVDTSFMALPSAVSSLSLNQKLSVSKEVTAALSALSQNSMCHGGMSDSAILISVVSDSDVKVKLIELGIPEIGDVTEEECMSADASAWAVIKKRYTL